MSTNPTKPESISPATYLWLAAAFALFTAAIEIVYHLAEKTLGWRWYTRLSPDITWMTPVADLCVFALPGVLFFLLSALVRSRRWLVPAVFLFSYLFFAKILLLYDRIDALPMIILGVGLAVQSTRIIVGRWEKAAPRLRRYAVLVVLLLVAVVVSQKASAHWRQRQEHARIPPAASDAPNVLLVVMDTVRAQNLSLHGYERRTSPNLEKWAKKGAWFERAFTTAPWTLPSHAGMFTGRYAHELSAHWRQPLDDLHPTLAEVLRDRGYLTAGFSANRYYAGYDSGLARGFVHYRDYNHSPGEFINCSALTKWFFNKRPVRTALDYFDLYGRKDAAEVNASFLDWLSAHTKPNDDGAKPFFAFLNYFDAHDPYLPPAPYDSMFGPPPTLEERAAFWRWWESPAHSLPPRIVDAALRGYDGGIAYLDDQLNRLLEELDRRGSLKDTLVIITSDHGEHFGEHGRFIHGNSLHRQLLHVPLVVLFPGRIPEGTQVKQFVTLRDLPATVSTLLKTKDAPFPGSTLSRYWDAQYKGQKDSPLFQVAFAIPPQYARPDQGRSPTATGWILSFFQDGKHYIRYGKDGSEEIYDFDADPRDQTNLAALPEHKRLVESFRSQVEQFCREHQSYFTDFPVDSNERALRPVSRIDLVALFFCRCGPK
ncbi:MAG: sulfatase [Gemmataceae bacterium]|nr:sulfatase [Gemmataceae bacterium]MCI0739207.1 sulfatase [Gemmataceae bacterium]